MKAMGAGAYVGELERMELLEQLTAGAARAHDLDFAVFNQVFLVSMLAKQQQAAGFADSAKFVDYLIDERAAALEFYQSLRIRYSEFFRNPLMYALLEQQVLPALISSKKLAGRGGLRIWSAGCAAGQEAWSLAMLVDELVRLEDPPVPYRIFASDLSEADLAVARAAIYSAEALANVRLRHLNNAFVRQGDLFAIAGHLRPQVDFSLYDLLDRQTSSPMASIYGDFDLILCCNVLLYYRPAVQRQILVKLTAALAEGGFCIAGESEREIVARFQGLRAVAPASVVFQKQPEPQPFAASQQPVAADIEGAATI